MHHFAYRDGVLHAEDVSLVRIAAEVGTRRVGDGALVTMFLRAQ